MCAMTVKPFHLTCHDIELNVDTCWVSLIAKPLKLEEGVMWGFVAQQTSAQDAYAENRVENEETRHGLDE